jgi:hypothetical protein
MVGGDYTRALQAVASADGVAPHEIAGHTRTRRISHARWAFWDCLQGAGWASNSIAAEGGFDHSSVMRGISKFAALHNLPRVNLAPFLRFPHQAAREAERLARTPAPTFKTARV